MQNELREKLESAALLLDDYHDRVATPGPSDGIVLEADAGPGSSGFAPSP